MAFYIGEYILTVEQKGGRIVIPNDLRYEMDACHQKVFYLLRGIRDNILMIPSQLWENVSKQFSNEPVLNPTSQIAMSYIVGGSSRVQIDAQYRMALPGWVREHAGIRDTAVIVGCGEYLELWNENSRKAFIKSPETKKLIEKLLAKLFPSKFDEEIRKVCDDKVVSEQSGDNSL